MYLYFTLRSYINKCLSALDKPVTNFPILQLHAYLCILYQDLPNLLHTL